MALKTVLRNKIKVADRFRQDMGNIEELAQSIRDKGLLQPITIDTDMNLLAGGRRYEACGIAELDKIPCLVRETVDELDAREVELIENVMRKDMSWQEGAKLTACIQKLYEDKHGKQGSKTQTARALDKSNAYVTRSLQLAEAITEMPELEKCKNEDDVFKTMRKMEEKIVVGELRSRQTAEIKKKYSGNYLKVADANYQIQDAFEGFDELRQLRKDMPGAGVFDLIEVDPPYGIDLQSAKKGDITPELDKYNEVEAQNYDKFLYDLCQNLWQCAADDAWVIFWFGPTWHTEVFRALRRAGFMVDDIPAIWTKGSGQTMAPDLYLARCYEPFAIARKGSPQIRKRGQSNVFNIKPVPPEKKYHPTQRPMMLMRDILSTFAYPNAKVLVPFLGSGVTLRAAYASQCYATGWELNAENKDHFMLQVEQDINNKLYGVEDEQG